MKVIRASSSTTLISSLLLVIFSLLTPELVSAMEDSDRALNAVNGSDAARDLATDSARDPAQAPGSSAYVYNEQKVFNTEELSPYAGAVISKIRINGLKRTSERAARWLLTQKEGDLFDPNLWVDGIHKLYNAGALYNLNTIINREPGDDKTHPRIIIDINTEDRWTLLPFGNFQAGGGSFAFGGGVMNSNLFGYFIHGEVGYSVFDSTATYDVIFSQEYLANTEWMWETDFSQTGTPVTFQNNDGSTAGDYTWFRKQERIMLGRRFATKRIPLIRLFSYAAVFEDQTAKGSENPSGLTVENGTQYAVQPNLILGRSQLTNFLEQGYEFTVAPMAANFFSSRSFSTASGAQSTATSYSQLLVSYKQVFIHQNTNIAMMFTSGLMTPAPAPYLFRLGGYDSVRGFSTNRLIGRAYVSNNLEYRPYLFKFSPPLLDQITGEWIMQGVVFQDAAVMWNSDDPVDSTKINTHKFLLSHGLGIRGNIIRFANCIGRLDIAHTTIPSEGWGVSLGVGQFF